MQKKDSMVAQACLRTAMLSFFYSANARDRVEAKRKRGCIANEVNYSNSNARDRLEAKRRGGSLGEKGIALFMS